MQEMLCSELILTIVSYFKGAKTGGSVHDVSALQPPALFGIKPDIDL